MLGADGGRQYQSRLLAAREYRKRAEQDAQLLANRIALLKVGATVLAVARPASRSPLLLGCAALCR
jgi:hypothetical protein